MTAIRLYNTAARSVVPVELSHDRDVRIYTCGPTVYRPVHLGNLRSYLLADWLKRLLQANGYTTRHVKNITDVGHMRQELLDRGDDKVVAEALSAGVTPAQIAERYTREFFRDEQCVNVQPADVFPRATDHVRRMVSIASALVDSGHAYERGGNVYFRVGSFGAYGSLGGAVSSEGLRQGVRAEADPLKEDPRDFALWKAAEPGRAALVWPSPWGDGFPGWHIECTAMSTQHLGPQIDIHTGGVDNIFPHHEDERAQSEAFTGLAPFAAVWVHGQHLLADGVKMAKATGNAYTLSELLELNFEPLAFRYLCLTAHYRARLNFTFTSLRAAQTGLRRLRAHIAHWQRLANGSPGAADADARGAAGGVQAPSPAGGVHGPSPAAGVQEPSAAAGAYRLTEAASVDQPNEAAGRRRVKDAASVDAPNEVASVDRPSEALGGDRPNEAARGGPLSQAAGVQEPSAAAGAYRLTEAASVDRPSEAIDGGRPNEAASGGRLSDAVAGGRLSEAAGGGPLSEAAEVVRQRFWALAADDLALPRCLALLWSLARGDQATLPPADKVALARDFDRLLGLDLLAPPPRRARDPFRGAISSPTAVPDAAALPDTCELSLNVLVQAGEDLEAVRRCVASALRLRSGASQPGADAAGATPAVLPDGVGSPIRAAPPAGSQHGAGGSAAAEVQHEVLGSTVASDHKKAPAGAAASAAAGEHHGAVGRAAAGEHRESAGSAARGVHHESAGRAAAGVDLEVVLVDATGTPVAHRELLDIAGLDDAVRLVWIDHDPGAAAGRNLGLRVSRGRVVALLDASVEFVGDALRPLLDALHDPSIGAAGAYGLVTADMRHFHELGGVAPTDERHPDAEHAPDHEHDRHEPGDNVHRDPGSADQQHPTHADHEHPEACYRPSAAPAEHDPVSASAEHPAGTPVQQQLGGMAEKQAGELPARPGQATQAERRLAGEAVEVDALQGYLLAFRRADLVHVAPLDEHYRFYRILDLDLSYALRARVGRLVSLENLPLVRHRHALWEALSEGDREERSRKNFGRFLKRWDHRRDLSRHGEGAHPAGPVAVHG